MLSDGVATSGGLFSVAHPERSAVGRTNGADLRYRLFATVWASYNSRRKKPMLFDYDPPKEKKPVDYTGLKIAGILAPLDPDLASALHRMMRADLDAWATLWFWSLVGSTIAVAVGIICEAPEVWQAISFGRKTVARIRTFWYVQVRKIDLNGWEVSCPELVTKNASQRRWVVKIGLIGWILVAAGVAGEGTAEYFVSDAETNIRAFDEADLRETQQSAHSATASASLANFFVDQAQRKSESAVKSSTEAQTIANGARLEADSFEADIRLAKKQATEAESHLKDALQLGFEAQAELKRVTTPRTLNQSPKLVNSLKPFTDMEYVFSGVSADRESIDLLLGIDDLLKAAGWKRGKSLGGFPGINPKGKTESDFSVPESLAALRCDSLPAS